MSSTEQPTTSHSNLQLVADALTDYAELTGIDLSKSPFAQTLEHSNSPHAILELLKEREKAFREYRDQNRTLIRCIGPAVEVLHAFSGTLGEVVSLVSNAMTCHFFDHDPRQAPFPPASAVFVGIDILLGVCSLNLLLTDSHVTYGCFRLPVESHQAMTLLWIYLNVWEISSNVSRSIQRSRPLP